MNSAENSFNKKPNPRRSVRARSSTGAGIIAIGLFLAFFAVLPLSLLYFEMARFGLMQQELRNITDFAALSGTAALASAPASGSTGQSAAMQEAVATFARNSILQTGFGPAPVDSSTIGVPSGTLNNIDYALNTGSSPALTTAKRVALTVTLRDQNGNVQTTGSTTAVTMAVAARYMDNTVFASQILPIQSTVIAEAFSLGGLPQIDLILCFDVSGSMDDQTLIYLYKRYWNGSAVAYQQLTTNQGGASTPGKIYDVFKPSYTGTIINAMQPQNLTYGSFPNSALPGGTGGTDYTYIFTESPWAPFPTNPNPLAGLRANLTTPGALIPEQGCPPGNYNSGTPASVTINGVNPTDSAYNTYFTDMIPAGVFPPTPSATPPLAAPIFTSAGQAIEASRGNLENAGAFDTSQADTVAGLSVSSGAYNSFWSWVQSNAEPVRTARTETNNFFTIMNTSANCHFGLITFSNAIGTGASSQFYNVSDTNTTNANIDRYYLSGGSSAGGTSQFPLPNVILSQTLANYTQCTAAVSGNPGSTPLPLGPCGKTNIAFALQEAISQLTNASLVRPSAKKAVVLFTDGVPNIGTNTTAPDYGSFAQATAASSANIPIFTIGLSQVAEIYQYETQVLGDSTLSGALAPLGDDGIAYLSGNLARYIPVTDPTKLRAAFQSIARSLVVLQ